MSKSTYTNTMIITGGTIGLGYEAALSLARHFPTHAIIIASRSDKTSAASSINKALNQTNTIFLPLDLASSSSITTFTTTIQSTYPQISHLLLNAALQFPKGLHLASNKVELTFQIAHLGHTQLFFQLLPHLTPTAHITITSSGTHDPAQKSGLPDAIFPSAAAVAHPDPKTANKDGREHYATAKLCNILFTYSLARHIATNNKHFTVNAFDPGLMPGTGLAREYPAVLRFIWLHVWPRMLPLLRLMLGVQNIHTARESGGNLAWVAVGEEVGSKGVQGKYFEGRKIIESSVMSHDEKKQENLWSWSIDHLAGENEILKGKWEKLEG